MEIMIYFDDPDVEAMNNLLKPYDMDFYDLLDEALTVGMDAVGLDSIKQFDVQGGRNRDFVAYKNYGKNVEKWRKAVLLARIGMSDGDDDLDL